MASVALAAEGAEGGEAAFSEESEEGAESKGVDTKQLGQIFGAGLSLINAVTNLTSTILTARDEANEDRRRRYLAGIVFPNKEDRNKLIVEGKIPSYYSTSNIIKTLRRSVLPYGWSEETAVDQGFAKEIMAGRYRKRNEDMIKSETEKERIKKETQQSLNEADALNQRIQLNASRRRFRENLL